MLVIPAFAKINLTLDVRRRRPDGLHDIESLVAAIDWHDLLGIALAVPTGGRPGNAEATRVSLHVTGPLAGSVPAGEDNLAVRAARVLAGLAGRPLDIRLWLEKRLPSRAGLGGGSADAAAVLRAGGRLLAGRGLPIASRRLRAAAPALGADVPVLLTTGLTMVASAGERLSPAPDADLDVAVVVAGAGDTAPAYGALRDGELGHGGRSARALAALERGRPPRPEDLGSSLEAPATRVNPSLGAALARLRQGFPERRWHLTGSGGCVFTLTASAGEAEAVAGAARRAGFAARACRTVGRGLAW